MSDDTLEGGDLMLLRSKFSKPASSGAAVRHAAEKRANLSPLDGRRGRGAVVRDAQINFKIASATKAKIVELARALDVSMVEVLERGLELIEAEQAKRKKGA